MLVPPRGRLAGVVRRADLYLYQTIRSSAHWLKTERAIKVPLPLGVKLRMWRRGFLSESVALYDLTRNDPADYLTDYQRFVRCPRINTWNGLYDHKMGLRAFLLASGFRQAETLAYLYEGRVLADPFSPDARSIQPAELLERLRGEGSEYGYVVKPEDGACGQGIFLLMYRNGEFLRQRGPDVEPFDLEQFIRDLAAKPRRAGQASNATLIERRLVQGAFWDRLYPQSANTIRLLVLWTPGEPLPFIARASQRIGTAHTIPTDNFTGGGISAPIALGTGVLGTGRTHPVKGQQPGRRFTHHPDTGAQLAGAVLPHWERITDAVIRAAASLPFNRMAGWDVLMDRDGQPVILEANGLSGVDVLQIHGGLLTDARVRRFYDSFGVLGRRRHPTVR
ncbi:MAG: hypothetical protein H0W67_03600 [Gemmatimonadales bacterium]|nr:hypothetical protein [Gemmatimonadales bacterium]